MGPPSGHYGRLKGLLPLTSENSLEHPPPFRKHTHNFLPSLLNASSSKMLPQVKDSLQLCPLLLLMPTKGAPQFTVRLRRTFRS